MQDLTVGTGAEVNTGDFISIVYEARLENGTVFDDSKQNTLFNNNTLTGVLSFVLGDNDAVIPGLNEGVAGMKEGGKRLVTIPHTLAYSGGIEGIVPSRATVIYEVELLERPTFEDVEIGNGQEVGITTTVEVLAEVFDDDVLIYDPYDPSTRVPIPYRFTIGRNHAIVSDSGFPRIIRNVVGLHHGLLGMKVGGIRNIMIPGQLAFGLDANSQGLPSGSLTIKVELLTAF